ncbi:hypothetical protein QQ008_23085 [Fulvivirgaceae bacterium BMA10]|uniref:WYL domain-containing protein n=1 Tax=Splendidivirga corallicola TaxID=3051826 RepID=A0ABT8KU72_9BACT|nr:hypothetical protein [Fulvivirgaceae bacterium BMA10]
MNEINGKILSERIGKVLDYLKENKITQYEVEQQLNYTSLSKAKNYARYPQAIIERKTRAELLEDLLTEYRLIYDEEFDRVKSENDKVHVNPVDHTLYYIMYYYAFARDTIGKAIVKIINKKRVEINFPQDEHWEGRFEVVENYTFIEAEKLGDYTRVKKLICLFSGTEKFGRPILLGTYSTVKRDGYPAAGSVLFEKVEQKELLEKKVKSETDPRIAYYLTNKVFIADTFTPNSLDNLRSEFRLLARYAGDYHFFYLHNNKKISKYDLIMTSDSKVKLNFEGVMYTGYYKFLDHHTIKLELTDGARFSHMTDDTIIIYLNTINASYNPFLYCVGISNAIETGSNSFSCLLIEKRKHSELPKEEIEKVLARLTNTHIQQS